MSFSNEWEDIYQQNAHMSVWPWSDLVSLVMQHKPEKTNFKVLELGCGAGANIPLFASLGASYYAVDGSETVVNKLHKKFPQFAKHIYVGDFTKDIPNDNFDLIVDRASLTCNSTASIVQCLNKCHKQLVVGGKFIGSDWYSTDYSDYSKGEQAEDVWTRKNFIDGSFNGTGSVHFTDKNHLLELFEQFKVLSMTHKYLCEEVPHKNSKFASWNLVAQKI
jgi:SAM-dependent methyltransferase